MNGLDYYIYYIFANAIAPWLCGTPFTPNVISFLHGIVVSGAGMYNLYKHREPLECLMLIYLRSLLDSLDGAVARACHNGSPAGDAIDSALDAFPVICVFWFAWYRVSYPSFYHKVAVPIVYGIIMCNAVNCNHDPSASFFCYIYYPNANAFVLFSIMAIKMWSMDHRVETKKQIAESGGIESLVPI
jgi:phosphatidylglycerophosphate synthase